MVRRLEILITEDSAKHLADARTVSEGYAFINFTFATTLEEAEILIERNRYDAVVTDVFFPIRKSEEPTSDSGLNLAKKVDAKGIPFVYNTSGNHHGRAYSEFLKESGKIWANHGFGTGKMIEAYPENPNAEKDTKQWNAAIDYTVLLVRSHRLGEGIARNIGSFLSFGPYGDYGELTEKMNNVLDETISIEDLCRQKNMIPLYPWSNDALKDGWEKGYVDTEKWSWNEEKDCLISLRSIKESDEKKFRETELKFRQDYVKALEFIRMTLIEYKK